MALEDLTRAELEAKAAERDIVIEEGSGAGGGVLKSDLVDALRAAGVESTEGPEGDVDRTPTRCRVKRKWSQRLPTGQMTYSPGSIAIVPRYRADYFAQTDPPHLEILD